MSTPTKLQKPWIEEAEHKHSPILSDQHPDCCPDDNMPQILRRGVGWLDRLAVVIHSWVRVKSILVTKSCSCLCIWANHNE